MTLEKVPHGGVLFKKYHAEAFMQVKHLPQVVKKKILIKSQILPRTLKNFAMKYQHTINL